MDLPICQFWQELVERQGLWPGIAEKPGNFNQGLPQKK
jgi:hypothetical protein